jgi:rod shape-determining protein MreD
MKYLWYFVLLYILLPFNLYVDLISILIFYLIFHEDERFALVFAFFAGLLIDLFHPLVLGINIIIYIVLVEIVIYIKNYIVRSIWFSWIVFIAFYAARTFAIYIALSTTTSIISMFLTIISFLPFVLVLNKLKYRVWMRI